jgi:protein subunit release factor B
MTTPSPSPSLTSAKPTDADRRLAALGVREADLEESFVRSSGPGGQNVNKTSTCVMLHHRPSGLVVKCQTSRQQAMNRTLARQMLADKLEARRETERRRIAAELEKQRRQRRGRSSGAKRRMLNDKKRQASKKLWRRRPGPE